MQTVYAHIPCPNCHILNDLHLCTDSAAIEAPFPVTMGLFGCVEDKWDQSCWWSLSRSSPGERQEPVSWLRNPHGRQFRSRRKGWNSCSTFIQYNKYLTNCQDVEISYRAAACLLSQSVKKTPKKHRNKSFSSIISAKRHTVICLCVCRGISSTNCCMQIQLCVAFKCIFKVLICKLHPLKDVPVGRAL